MPNPRGTLVGLALATTLAITGCNTGGSTTTTPATPADPKQALIAATAAIKEGNYSFTATGHEEKSTGVVHLPSRSAAMQAAFTSAEGSGTMQFRLVEPDRYIKMKIDMSALGDLDELDDDPAMAKLAEQLKQMRKMFSGKHWMHVDTSRVKNSKDLDIDLSDPDITGTAAMLNSAVTAQTAPAGWTGTLDLTKVANTKVPWTTAEATKAGDALKAVPFAATADAQGRLAKLTLDLPAIGDAPAHQRVIDFSGYGNATAQQKPPAAEVIEAPESAYKMFE